MLRAEVVALQVTSRAVTAPNTGRKGRPESAQRAAETAIPTASDQTRMNATILGSNRRGLITESMVATGHWRDRGHHHVYTHRGEREFNRGGA